MASTFNPDQLAMAMFLTICAIVNAWFVYTSIKRISSESSTWKYGNDEFRMTTASVATTKTSSTLKTLLLYSILIMSLFDIPWIWLCLIQCWNNTFNENHKLYQGNGNSSLGCIFMGWYMGFSLIAMMGSHCIVVYNLWNNLAITTQRQQDHGITKQQIPLLHTRKGLWAIAFSLLVLACLFATMPLIQGDGYRMTNAGFCYPSFIQPIQSGIMLALVMMFLSLATYIWYQIGKYEFPWCKFYIIYVCTWSFWIPACSYGIATGQDIPSPYLIIAAFLSHGNALSDAYLYGSHLFVILERDEGQIDNHDEFDDKNGQLMLP